MRNPPQEPDVVAGKMIAGVIGGVIASIIIGVLVMWGIEGFRTRELHGNPGAPAEQISGLPRQVNALETEPFVLGADGIQGNELAEHVLESYGWVDRNRQIVRVPITVAFDLYLARHAGPVAGRER